MFDLKARKRWVDELVSLCEVLALVWIMFVYVHHELARGLCVDSSGKAMFGAVALDAVKACNDVRANRESSLARRNPETICVPLNDVFRGLPSACVNQPADERLTPLISSRHFPAPDRSLGSSAVIYRRTANAQLFAADVHHAI